MEECVICGTPRFTFKADPVWFFPLVCSWECLITDPVLNEALNGPLHEDCQWVGRMPTGNRAIVVWSFGHEPPEPD